MALYNYKARSPDSRIRVGQIDAVDLEEAYTILERKGWEVFSLDAPGGLAKLESTLSFLNRVTTKDLVGAVRMLSVMISASVPITEAVRNIARQTKNPKFRSVLSDIADEVEGGNRLSDALEKHPKVFSAFFINMVRSGETTGQMAEVMNYLADQQEADYDLFSKLKGAISYPIVIFTGMIIAGVVMMVFVVPKLTQVLEETGAELPWTTKVLIAVSDFMVGYWWLLLLGVIAFGTAFVYWIRTPYGRYQWDLFKMKIPILGLILRYMYVVRYCQSMATLMKGGLTMVHSLEIAAEVIGNTAWRQTVIETIQAVNDGAPMASVMAKKSFIPSMMVQMVTIGETSGKLHEVLERLSDFYTRNVRNIAANMLTLIEPVIMIILGVAVGIMVAAIMLPLYNISSGV